MIVLAIETSCDETAAAAVEGTGADRPIKVLSSVVGSSLALHIETGGVVPEVAAREQLTTMQPILTQALKEARIDRQHIDGVAVTQGPGLIGSLLVGVETAKVLALSWRKPLLPVNHLLAHVLANWVEVKAVPKFPALGIIVSGGHTELIGFNSPTDYRWLGGTRDDAAGECFDKCARAIFSAPYPGGPAIATAAKCAQPTVKPILPRPMIKNTDLEMSFSGLKTAVVNAMKSGEYESATAKNQLAYDLEQAIAEILTSKIERAIAQFKPASILAGGGVVANQVFRDKLELLGRDLNLPVFVPALKNCGDNAVMIGAAAILTGSQIDPLNLRADPSLRILR